MLNLFFIFVNEGTLNSLSPLMVSINLKNFTFCLPIIFIQELVELHSGHILLKFLTKEDTDSALDYYVEFISKLSLLEHILLSRYFFESKVPRSFSISVRIKLT